MFRFLLTIALKKVLKILFMANKTSKERGLGFLTFGPFFSVSNNWLLTECQLYVPWECSSKQDRQPHPWTPRFRVTRASMRVPVGKWRSPSLGSSPVTLLEYLFVFNFMPHKPCLFLLSVLNIHDHKRLRFPNQSSMWATFKQGPHLTPLFWCLGQSK